MFLKQHPFLVAIIGIFLLLIAGAALVWNKTAARPTDGAYTWGRSGGFSNLVANQGSRTSSGTLREQFSQEDYFSLLAEKNREDSYTSLIPQTNVYESRGAGTTTNTAFSYDENELEALLASIKPTAQIVQPYDSYEDETDLSDVFAFVPATVAATTSSGNKRLSRTQAALHTYGNEAGSYIESYADRWEDQAIVLRTFIEDRTDENAAVVDDLAFALRKLGRDLASMDPALIPQNIQHMHDNIATGYQELGEGLVRIAEARDDDVLLEAIISYNGAADSFAQRFIELVTVFSVAEVTFSQDEPGRVFVFTPAPTLGN